MLFGFNRGIRPFYAAHLFDDVSRGSVLCLLDASFEKRFPQRHNSIFYAKIEDHGVRWGDMGQILARLRRSVASRVAQDLPYWVMCPALYRLTCMALEMGCEAGACFSVAGFMSCIRGSGGQFPPIYFSEPKKIKARVPRHAHLSLPFTPVKLSRFLPPPSKNGDAPSPPPRKLYPPLRRGNKYFSQR